MNEDRTRASTLSKTIPRLIGDGNLQAQGLEEKINLDMTLSITSFATLPTTSWPVRPPS